MLPLGFGPSLVRLSRFLSMPSPDALPALSEHRRLGHGRAFGEILSAGVHSCGVVRD